MERSSSPEVECLLGSIPAQLVEILVVSDGSTDATEAIAESFADRGVRLIRAPRAGKAAAIKYSIGHATGEILFFTDVRQALDPDALSHLVANFADPSIAPLPASSAISIRTGPAKRRTWNCTGGMKLFARRRHSRMDSTFSATGAFYAIRRSLTAADSPRHAVRRCRDSLASLLPRLPVIFDPEAIASITPTAKGREFRRKLRTLAGIWQVHARARVFTQRQIGCASISLSHRFARLALPWAIPVVYAATLGLPASPFRVFC